MPLSRLACCAVSLSLRKTWLLPVLLLLGGCNLVVLNPAGDIARQQGQLIVVATALMLIVIVPVIALTLFFAWRYRASNANAATYAPDWDHSTQLELVIWAIPLLIIITLGAITWIHTHTLDPYRPLDRIATVNELAAPVDRPIHFKLTSSTVMNAFYIPELAGMIYTMPGMQTELNAVINAPGEYQGISSNYSGAGFSGMHFPFHATDAAGFEAWVARVRASGSGLDRARYLELEKPSERDPARHFARVDASLYDAILNRCVDPLRMCMHEMMAIDAAGGRPASISGLASLAPRKRGDWRGSSFVTSSVCSVDEAPKLWVAAPTAP